MVQLFHYGFRITNQIVNMIFLYLDYGIIIYYFSEHYFFHQQNLNNRKKIN